MLADRMADWPGLIWERDLGLTSDALDISQWPPDEPISGVVGDLGLALRLTGLEDPVRVLTDLDAADWLPEHTRVLVDVPAPSEGGSIGIAEWLEVHGFRVFLLLAEPWQWRVMRQHSLRDLDGKRGRREVAGDPLATDSPNPASLYAVRGADMLAVSVMLHSGGLGGAELSCWEWSSDLFAQGHMVHCYLPVPEGKLAQRLQQSGVTWSFHSTGWWITSAEGGPWDEAAIGIEDLIRDLANQDPDVVVTQTAVVPGGALASAALGIPHVWWAHERPDPEYGLSAPTEDWAELGEVMRRLSRRRIANSAFVADCYWPGDDVEIIYPVRLPLQIQAPAEGPGRVHEMHPDGIPVVAVVGALSHAKGQHLVVAALEELRTRGVLVRARFAGEGPPATVASLNLLAEELGVSDLVSGLGTWLPLADTLDGVQAVIVPSWGEGFGRVPVEAISHAVPVVYSRSGALGEFLEDGVTGLAFEPRNVTELANAIERIVSDEALRTRLAGSVVDLQSRLAPFDARTRLPAVLREARSQGLPTDRSWPEWAIGEIVRTAAASAVQTRERLTDERNQLTVVNELLRQDLSLTKTSRAAEAQVLVEVRSHLAEVQSLLAQREASLDLVLNSRTWRAKASLCRALKPFGLCKQ